MIELIGPSFRNQDASLSLEKVTCWICQFISDPSQYIFDLQVFHGCTKWPNKKIVAVALAINFSLGIFFVALAINFFALLATLKLNALMKATLILLSSQPPSLVHCFDIYWNKNTYFIPFLHHLHCWCCLFVHTSVSGSMAATKMFMLCTKPRQCSAPIFNKKWLTG